MDPKLIKKFARALNKGESVDAFVANDDDNDDDKYKNDTYSREAMDPSDPLSAPIPEVNYLIRGSSAGVGSEYFDIYRRLRMKERARVHQMQFQAKQV